MRARRFGADVHKLAERRLSERTARSGQQYAANADCLEIAREAARQRLENRVVLAVDRQQRRATGPRGLHEHGAGGDERFLVGEQHFLSGPRGSEGGP